MFNEPFKTNSPKEVNKHIKEWSINSNKGGKKTQAREVNELTRGRSMNLTERTNK